MAKRYVVERDGPPERMLGYYTLIVISASVGMRLVLGSHIEFWVKVVCLAVAALAVCTHCFFHLGRRHLEDRLWFILNIALLNGICCAFSASLGYRSLSTTAREAIMLAVLGGVGTLALCTISMPLLDIILNSHRELVGVGHCTSCGYDLTGNVSGTCPECGESPVSQEGDD